MSSIRDIRPIFLIARAFGLAPYYITDTNVTISRHAVFYSIPWFIFYLFSLYNRLYVYFTGDVDFKFRILSITRTILAVLALILDIALSIGKDRNLQNALNFVRKYDVATKYNVETQAKILRIHTWTIFTFLVAYFSVIGWFTYFYESYANLLAAIIYVYLYLPLSIGVMRFVILTLSVMIRFQHLNQMLLPEFSLVIAETNSKAKRLHLKDVCWLHNVLSQAAKDLNSLYAVRLLLWFANFTFNTITRIHDFMEDDSSVPATIAKCVRDGGLVFVFVLLVILLASVCHATSLQANKVSSIVFSPYSRYFRIGVELYKQDNYSIGQYFILHQLNFSAAYGLFQINLPLLLKIAGAMTTYLVILKSPAKG